MYKITLLCLLLSSQVFGETKAYTGSIDFGRPPTKSELAAFPTTFFPDGKNLPKGRGNYKEGESLYKHHCAACHGHELQGQVAFHAPRLIGGRGSLQGTKKAIKTVESFWPNPVSLYDYISRAMPFLNPKIFTADEVYSLCAYILAKANIIDKSQALDHQSLPEVSMPNKKGFVDPYGNFGEHTH